MRKTTVIQKKRPKAGVINDISGLQIYGFTFIVSIYYANLYTKRARIEIINVKNVAPSTRAAATIIEDCNFDCISGWRAIASIA
jgi:hypothetical protein